MAEKEGNVKLMTVWLLITPIQSECAKILLYKS